MERIQNGSINGANGTKVVGEIFKVEKEYETAIEIALGAGISNVITENEAVAKNLINYLKSNKLGRATFLPLNNIRGNRLIDSHIEDLEGYIGIAADIISYDEKYKVAINNLLGRTIVARDMDSALRISKRGNNSYRIVTLTGEIIAPGGALTGGSIQAKHTNILGRKREIEDLGKNLILKNQELKTALKELNEAKEKVKELDENLLNNRDEVHFNNIEIAKKESEISQLKNEIFKLKASFESTKNDVAKNEEELERLNLNLVAMEKELNSLESANDSNKELVIELEQELELAKADMNKARENLTELKVNKASIDEIILSKSSDLTRILLEVEDNNNKIVIITSENEKNKDEIENLNNSIKSKDEAIELIKLRLQDLEANFKEEEVQKEKLKEEFRLKDSAISEEGTLISKDEAELNKREVQRAKTELERDNLYTKLNEELDLTLAEAKEIAVEVEDTNALRENIGYLKRSVTALGVVNLAAIEEYEEVKEKYEFMEAQREDLEKSKEELVSVISDMTDKMKVIFRENFKILNKNFNETFKELFKGGFAELILAEGDELTANIDINVEPPGKKLQNINLMSGGEKVLSAIALLFAILKMKPTPFCILDEIEAALDDANVYRYAEFLTEFSKNIQFIVITHRKGTMEASDVMYGVTMEEKGISKVVSVDLSK